MKYFSHNGKVLPIKQAVVPLDNIEYTYGYGVYETLRVVHGQVQFLEEHCARLMESARIIELAHEFSTDFVAESIEKLVQKAEVDTANLKILLIGGRSKDAANLYITCHNPLFPDRKLYKDGAKCITYNHERPWPHAKSLNMLPSYLAYRKAQAAGAYDALLVNRQGRITEGTRTNFFCIKNKVIFSPPESVILLGTMRTAVLTCAKQNGYEIHEQDIPLADLHQYDGAFLTSTSTKIMPLRSIDGHTWESIPTTLLELMRQFDNFLNR